MSTENAFLVGVGMGVSILLVVGAIFAGLILWSLVTDWLDRVKHRRSWPLQVHRTYVRAAIPLFEEWIEKYGDREAVRELSWGTRVWLANNPVSRPNTPG